ncbi:bifunctional precorrin-2 dehydrogenase/sirohydrochlorin ferrochelatase [Ureibacillus sp. FSL K6-8385]|nr:bifunctional precorrin-2 dehydrogenase/sirohydrochlorin ferrochelatase [Ureibacillus terrenus]MED3660818.1 bifunctional precorrin-2 dehydrogenase/sirohydrochlorin ferrochelatase [Ureibacillus terrenus]MED3763006.1 bifunctional precorrin-2 dehydrogenase/sirohydrochlorin ferrochelatase [Ureibacillus terrenus]
MYYPMMLNIEGKNVAFIGGGRVAYQKLKGLENTKANITIISPSIIPEIEEWMKRHRAKWIQKEFEPSDIEQAHIIFAATSHAEVNREVKLHKKEHQLLLLSDNPKESDFLTPAVVRRGKLALAISTNGASPALAKKIKRDLEQQFAENFGDYVQFLEEARKMVINKIDDAEKKKGILVRLLDPIFCELTINGNIEKRDQLFMKLFAELR